MEEFFSRDPLNPNGPLVSMQMTRQESENSDSCSDPFPMALAMACVRYQKWGTTYDGATALQRGTLFPDLDKPFIGEEAVSRGRK